MGKGGREGGSEGGRGKARGRGEGKVGFIRFTCSQVYVADHIAYNVPIWNLHRVQWNLSNPDTLGTEGSVLISEVS